MDSKLCPAFIDPEARVDDQSKIGDGSVVEAGARVIRSRIGELVRICSGALVVDSIIHHGALIGEGAVIARGAEIGRGAVIAPNVSITGVSRIAVTGRGRLYSIGRVPARAVVVSGVDLVLPDRTIPLIVLFRKGESPEEALERALASSIA